MPKEALKFLEHGVSKERNLGSTRRILSVKLLDMASTIEADIEYLESRVKFLIASLENRNYCQKFVRNCKMQKQAFSIYPYHIYLVNMKKINILNHNSHVSYW
ncbi:hypothetical protein NPIL_517911 [Nephila pilipes]|uniref:Uncharacterized protein n=1 Tax=Nephila pilipes TaxID=299642 RepID=A0A8X6IWK6_NEPPI|nr:hypothetical protein NPIL_517911 [Nephila pilipes]